MDRYHIDIYIKDNSNSHSLMIMIIMKHDYHYSNIVVFSMYCLHINKTCQHVQYVLPSLLLLWKI